jgi:DNA-binding FrmR family transcriptional regulator
MQARHNQERLVAKLQSAIVYLETIMEVYQSKEDPLELVQALQSVIGVLKEIHREVITQELTSVLSNEALPVATRNATVEKLFQVVVRQKG